MNQKLLELAQKGQMEELEEAWLQEAEDPTNVRELIATLEEMPETIRRERGRSLVSVLVDAIDISSHPEEASEARMGLVDLGDTSNKLRAGLLESLRAAYGENAALESFLEEADVASDDHLKNAVQKFRKLWGMRAGCAITHAGGWGVGVVRDVNTTAKELDIEFVEGHKVEMPYSSALDVLEPLPENDFRAFRYTRLEELQQLAKDDPGEVIRMVLAILGGRGNSAKVKEELCGDVITQKEWTSWWKGARQRAAEHPYIAVEGGSRPLFILRQTPVSPGDEVKQAIEKADDLGEATQIVRDFLANRPAEDVVNATLAALVERLNEGEHDPVHQVEALLLLCKDKPEFQERLNAAVRTESDEQLGAFLDGVPKSDVRKLLLQSIREALPDTWQERLLGAIKGLGPEASDGTIEFLAQNKAMSELRELLTQYLKTPSRMPFAVFHLARRYVAGRLGEGDSPSMPSVALCLLQLYESQCGAAERGDKGARSLLRKMENLLHDSKLGIVQALGEKGKKEEVAPALALATASRHIGPQILSMLRDVAYARFPDMDTREEVLFWETEHIYTTKKGREKKQEELRVLMEEKIPENSRAIGVAAGHGDLSENAEWTAAMDEQRLLTQRATELEEELKKWRPLEEQELPPDRISPGYEVTYRTDSGEEASVLILGPWDVDDGVMSYKAPLAQGLLGCRVGDEVTLELPSGSMDVTVIKATPAL